MEKRIGKRNIERREEKWLTSITFVRVQGKMS